MTTNATHPVTDLLQSLNVAVHEVVSERALLAEEAKRLRAEVRSLRARLAARDAQYAATRHAIVSSMQTLSFFDNDIVVSNSYPSVKAKITHDPPPSSSEGVRINPFLSNPFGITGPSASNADSKTIRNSDEEPVLADSVRLQPSKEGEKPLIQNVTTTACASKALSSTAIAEKSTHGHKPTAPPSHSLGQSTQTSCIQTPSKLEGTKQLPISPSPKVSSDAGPKEVCNLSNKSVAGEELVTGTQASSDRPRVTPTLAKTTPKSSHASPEPVPSKTSLLPPAPSSTTNATAVKKSTPATPVSPGNPYCRLNSNPDFTSPFGNQTFNISYAACENSAVTGSKLSQPPSHARQHHPSKTNTASSNRISAISVLNEENLLNVGIASGSRSPSSLKGGLWPNGSASFSSVDGSKSQLGSDSDKQRKAKTQEVNAESGDGSFQIKKATSSERQTSSEKQTDGGNGAGGLFIFSDDCSKKLQPGVRGDDQLAGLVHKSSANSAPNSTSVNEQCATQAVSDRKPAVKGAVNSKAEQKGI